MAPARRSEKSKARQTQGGESIRSAWLGAPRPVYRFLLIFVVLALPFYAVMGIASLRASLFTGYLNLNAQIAGALLRLLGEDIVVRETQIFSSRFSVSIMYGCDAFEPSGLFTAAVLAFPVPFRLRVIGSLVGIAALFSLNLVRIVTLFFIGISYPRFFDTAHIQLWQVLFVLLTIALWIGWARWALTRSVAGRS